MNDYIVVTTTTDGRDEARRIAELLVQDRLAACVQVVGPIESTYWWEGAVQQSEEWLCLVKTREDRYGAVESAIRQAHSYDVPEILALPISAGSETYLRWIDAEAGANNTGA